MQRATLAVIVLHLTLGRPLAAVQTHGSIAIDHVTVISMGDTVPRRDMTVAVSGGRIEAIARSGSLRLPPDVSIVNARGKFMIPGLWDMHVHALRVGRPAWFFPLFVANGVTGVREMGTYLDTLLYWRAQVRKGRLLGPRIIGGQMVDGPDQVQHYATPIPDVASAVQVMDSLRRRGVDFVKVYSRLPREAYFAIANESRRYALPFAGHVPDRVSATEASDAGQRSMEHLIGVLEGCFDELPAPLGVPLTSQEWKRVDAVLSGTPTEQCGRLFSHFLRNRTWHTPTLTWWYGWAPNAEGQFADDPRLAFVPSYVRTEWARPTLSAGLAQRRSRLQSVAMPLVSALHQAGIGLLAGTDASDERYVFPGFSLHEELALLVRAGLSPFEALATATINPAKYFAATDSMGTIEAGKIADLVILDADPLADIRNTTRIWAVVLRGQFLNRGQLDSLISVGKRAVRSNSER